MYRTDGTKAAQFSLKSGSAVLAAAGSRIFVASAGQLNALRRDGTLESLGRAAGGASGIYVLDRSGQGPFIPTTGEPVGYLN